jgi:maleate isomerase
MEPHASSMVPEGVSVHAARIKLGQIVTPETLETMVEDIDRASELLATIPVDILLLGCTSGSLIKGVGYDKQLIERMKKASGGIQSTTTSTAVLGALKTLNLKRIAVATPYIKEINEAEKRFFEENGLEVAEVRGLELKTNDEFSSQPPYVIYRLARGVYKDHPESDGVFISCTSLRAPETIETLERDILKPVVTSTQASVWSALRKIGVMDSIEGYGELLREY